MSNQLQKIIQQCVVRYLDGDREMFERLTREAAELYDRDRHLFVSIQERVGQI